MDLLAAKLFTGSEVVGARGPADGRAPGAGRG